MSLLRTGRRRRSVDKLQPNRTQFEEDTDGVEKSDKFSKNRTKQQLATESYRIEEGQTTFGKVIVRSVVES